MSGRFAPSRPPRRTVRAALAAAVVAGCAGLLGPAAAQPPADPPGLDTVDDRPPLPPEVPKRPATAAKYRVPDRDRAMFAGFADPKTGVVTGGIEDDKPLASEKQNQNEYAAWTEVVQHARQFAAAELVEQGRRDLTRDDLTFAVRTHFRLDLVRLDGKLTKARRVRPTRELEQAGLTEQFEAWLVPADEPPGNPVCVVFTDWPADLPALPAIQAGHAAGESAALDRWASVGGYSFKLMAYPGPAADPKTPGGPGWLTAPLLVGRSVVPLPGPPPAATSVTPDKGLRIFKAIRDDAPLGRTQTAWEETAAWNRVALHARKFTTGQLEAAARRNVTFADLFESHRADHQLELVYLQGRLLRLTESKPTRRLAEAGLAAWYEGWLVPDGEPRGNPVCLMLTELPPGLEPKRQMSVPVAVAGYSFKLLQYESEERRPDDDKKNVWKRAPLLIGRSVTIRGGADEDDAVAANWTGGFVPVVLGSVAGLVGLALAMAWWFRRGDREARAAVEAARPQNPFDV